jgi:DNA polymerase
MPVDPLAAKSLLAFWAEAGVEACYEAAPVDRTVRAPAAGRAAGRAALAPDASPQALPHQASEAVDAVRLAGECGDLAALVAAISAFEGCPLKSAGARQAVVWRGAPDAPVVVVGEAPGAEEDIQGAPFVGRAGKLLDRMLAAAGLEGRVFIINTVFWRPPGNRDPTMAEQLTCAPFLERAIALVRPSLLLLVGGAAAKSTLKQAGGILSLRGRWFEWRSQDGALQLPAMPTLHPAFLLRQPAAKKLAWADLLTVTERLDRPERPA